VLAIAAAGSLAGALVVSGAGFLAALAAYSLSGAAILLAPLAAHLVSFGVRRLVRRFPSSRSRASGTRTA
jgi:hypothetical protein